MRQVKMTRDSFHVFQANARERPEAERAGALRPDLRRHRLHRRRRHEDL